MARALRTSALLMALAGLVPLARVAADDPKPEAQDSPLRLFHVDALVAGRPNFIPSRLGIVSPDRVSDEEHPLFGAQAEEPTLPVGGIDELIELLKSEVEPDSWESVSGVAIKAMGANVLVVKHRPEALAALGAAIKRWEDRWQRSVTVEVQAVHLPAGGAALTATDLAALVTREPGPGVTVTALPGQRVTAFGGKQRAYVQDYDVEVAQKAKGSDPIVGVANLGLAVDLRAVPSGVGDRVSLELQGTLADWLAAPQVPTVVGGTIEVPTVALTEVRVATEVPVGAWTLVDGPASLAGKPAWAFLVRARVNAHVAGPASKGDSLPVLENAGMGKLERRTFDISALQQKVGGRIGAAPSLVPSNYTPPEPPELSEPTEPIAAEALLDLIRVSITPEVWLKGTVETKKETLIARAPDTALLAVERLLGALKRSLLWTVEVEGEVLDVPAALAVGGEALLSEPSAKALEAARADGSAVTVDRVRVSSLRGARNNVRAGRERAYLSDFEVEIAEDSVIGNPVVQNAFDGVVLDIEPTIDSTGTCAAIVVRFTRTWLPETLPTYATSWGEIHVPETRMVSLRTMVDAPFGKTTVVGSAVENGRRTVLLLTPRLKRAGD